MRLTCYPNETKDNVAFAYGKQSEWKKMSDKEQGLLKKAIKKLGQLEDIEQELGVELITLFKVLKNGAIFSKPNEEVLGIPFEHIELSPHLVYGLDKQKWRLVASGYERETQDYGKTWALTKEVLEDE